MVINFVNEKNEIFYDFETLRKLLRTNKSKLYRMIKKYEIKEASKYKNKHLYNEEFVLLLMEALLNERLKKVFANEQ